jgi:ribulose kinase
MLGASAAGAFNSLTQAMAAMSAAGNVIEPSSTLADYHERKYRVFHQLHEDQLRYEAMMDAGVA